MPNIDELLNAVNYENDYGYVPSDFALEFINFIKLVNDGKGEENKSPVLHFKILDLIYGKRKNIANMLFRGAAKTSLVEYLFLYLGVYGSIPGFGKVPLALYVSDSIENGVKNMRKNLEYRWENSDFLKKYIPQTRFTDIRWEFKNLEGNVVIIKGYGAQALSLDTEVIMVDGSRKPIEDVNINDYIMTPSGVQTRVVDKSEVFHRPMYKIKLEDGRELKVCEEHLNSVVIKQNFNNKADYCKKVMPTKELVKLPLQHIRCRKRKHKPDYISKENLLFIENNKPIQFFNKHYQIDPYVLGLLLGDGSIKKDGSNILHCYKDDFNEYVLSLPDTLGKPYIDKRNSNVISISIKGISQQMRNLSIVGHGNYKFIPEVYQRGSVDQRIALLQGLMDTDGSIQKNGRMDFSSNSERLVDGVATLVRSLGGTAKKRRIKNRVIYRVEIWIDICPFRLSRKVSRFTGTRLKNLVAIKSITPIEDEPSQCIAVADESHEFLVEDFIRTHNTGVRGSKEMGVRPVLAVLDDLISDEDARSKTVISSIEDTVYKAINYALHPTRNKIIWNGTPFNSNDPLYKAVESGAWYSNVFPVCDKFPCSEEEFNGAWADRFNYEYVKREYDKATATGQINSFNQELMLRIMSDEDRVILDSDVIWYKRSTVLANKQNYNFYITTDFATSASSSADYSAISVWAYSNEGNWLWVDGVCRRQLMDRNINDLFRLVQIYKPQLVGIEVTGQQGGFIQWIQDQMIARNVFFTLASDSNNGKPGIRPNTNKYQRFSTMVPMFKASKIWLPEEKKADPALAELWEELRLVTVGQFKSKHDDMIDTVSMLSSLQAWKPSVETNFVYNKANELWEDEVEEEDISYNSYLV